MSAEQTWPCRSKPEQEWCDYLPGDNQFTPGGFMGHTCHVAARMEGDRGRRNIERWYMLDLMSVIRAERARQDEKWGPLPRAHGMAKWLAILMEEVGELSQAVLQMESHDKAGDWAANFEKEAVQCMAVLVAMVQHFRIRREENCNHPCRNGRPDGSMVCTICGDAEAKGDG